MADEQLCAICGKEPATTEDHLPPKGIFPKPRPVLIKVPACFKCNNSASADDERFRVYLSLHVGVDTPETKALWENHALPSVRHNQRLLQRIITGAKRVLLQTEAGVIIGERMAVLWDSRAHDKTIERMIRGLYFHHYGDIIGDRARIKVQWLRRLNPEMHAEFNPWPANSLGGASLIYRYGRAPEGPLHSAWLFQFYNKHWASGHTTPLGEEE